METQRFEIRYDSWCGWMLGLLGMGRSRSFVEVGPDTVTVRMGWAFHASIPLSAVASAGHDTARVLGWGVHGWRGRWLVNGSSHGLVSIELDPQVPARVTGFPIKLGELRLSLEEPDALLSSVGSSELPS